MSHLSDDQLSARLDLSGAADPAAADAADRHLADCAECRERLAALSELDASMKAALTHDPGDAYFASFADRVTARIAASPAEAPATADAPARAAAKPSGGGGFFGWLLSPRGLTLAGSMAGVAVVAALAYVLTRDGGADRFAQQLAPKSEVGATADARPPVETPSAPATTEAPAPEAVAASPTPTPTPTSAARKEAATSAAPAPALRTVPSARAQEVRTDASGEPVAVQNRDLLQGRPTSAPAPSHQSNGPVRVQKPQTVSPMGSTPAQRAPETAESAAPPAPAPAAARSVPQATPFAAPPTSAPATPPTASPPAPNPAPAKSRFDVSKLFEKAKSTPSGSTSTPQSPQAPPSQSQGFASPPAANDAAVPRVTAPLTSPMSQPSLEGASGAKGGNARRATESNFRASAYDMAAGRAREAEAIAVRSHAATDWDRAATAWRQASQVAGEPGQERASRRAESEARMTAWRTEPNELRRMAARSAVRGWLAVAEPGADQDSAKKLEAELGR